MKIVTLYIAITSLNKQIPFRLFLIVRMVELLGRYISSCIFAYLSLSVIICLYLPVNDFDL